MFKSIFHTVLMMNVSFLMLMLGIYVRTAMIHAKSARSPTADPDDLELLSRFKKVCVRIMWVMAVFLAIYLVAFRQELFA